METRIPNRNHPDASLTWPGSGCVLPPAHEAALSHRSQPLKSWHFFSHKLSFNGRKILCIRGGLAEMEECVCPLKLPERNRDCRRTKLMLPPLCQPALPPPLKKKYSPELDCCHSNSIAESHYSAPHYVMAEEVGECCLNGIKFGGNHRLMASLH